MKIKKQKSRLHLGIGLLVLILVGGVGTYFMLANNWAAAEPQRPPLFSFDAPAAPGWYQAKLDTSTREGRRSLLLFDRDPTKRGDTTTLQSCHVSASLEVGFIDTLQKLAEIMASEPGYTSIPLGTRAASLQMMTGVKTYELHLYNMTVPEGASPIKSGNAFGYVQAGDYYIELQAVCDTPEQLESTLPALQAIRFDDTVSVN